MSQETVTTPQVSALASSEHLPAAVHMDAPGSAQLSQQATSADVTVPESPAIPMRRRDEWARAKETQGVICQTHIGGQALIEGIMMRGKLNWAIAVRQPDGQMHVEEHDLASGKDKNSWLHKPVIRGCTALVESLLLGYKALDIASKHAFDLSDETKESNNQPTSPTAATAAPPMATTIVADSQQCHSGLDPESSQAPIAQLQKSNTNLPDNPLTLPVPIAPAPPADSQQCHSSLDPESSQASTSQSCHSGLDPESSQAPIGQLQKSNTTLPDNPLPTAATPTTPATPTPPAPQPATPTTPTTPAPPKEDDAPLPKAVITVSMVIGVVLGIALFIVLPAFVTNLIVGDYGVHTILWNIVDGVLRIGIFIFYIWLIGRMKDIKRMFSYHGAEHKTIHCYEHGLPLTVENARKFPTLHVRCGTAFLLTTLIIAILVFTIVPIAPLIDVMGVTNGALRLTLVILARIILLPVVAGLSYELTVKWAGAHPEKLLVQIVLWPGLQMQRLTTNQPDDSMLECAIAAMNKVLEREAQALPQAKAQE